MLHIDYCLVPFTKVNSVLRIRDPALFDAPQPGTEKICFLIPDPIA
jgi:hypothetical protein